MKFSKRYFFQQFYEQWLKMYAVDMRDCLMNSITWMTRTDEGKKLVKELYKEIKKGNK